MSKKTLAAIIISLFICLVLSSPINALSFKETKTNSLTISKNILYVGGGGPGNYSVIQDAVDNASEGDTIFVFNGVYNHYFPNISSDYHSCVTIDKSITLIGEDKNSTVINGSGRYDVLSIESDDVTIIGFTIQNGGKPGTGAYGRGFHIPGYNNIIISNNIVQNNDLGFYIYYESENVLIYNNTLNENEIGIELDMGSKSVEVYNNVISDNLNGIVIDYDVESCEFYQNIISSNSIGIYLNTEKPNVIENNEIIDNELGISAFNSMGEIKFNNFINNEGHAFFVRATTLLKIPLSKNYKQDWNNNYWDDWEKTTPRIIKGQVQLFITFWIFRFPNPIPIEIPIGKYPSIQFDKSPSQEPYDIYN